MNYKAITAAAIASFALITTASPKAKANYAYCNNIGGFTNCHGSNGSSHTQNTIGGYTNFSGRDQYGNNYNGSCNTIGSITNCNSYGY